ncbi:MAG: ABC transporter permease [Lachnospirales bacterium]
MKKNIFYYIKKDWVLYLILIPVIIYYLVFKYIPMFGITIAFKDYNVFSGFMGIGSEWVGLDVFKEVFSRDIFWNAVRNTIVLNMLVLLVNFPAGITLALMLNEVRKAKFKKISQSILYLPHFISWVIVAGLVFNLFSLTNGSINNIIIKFGGEPIPFLIEEGWWIFTYVVSNVWKSIGWSTIIYLAALAGVDEALYEAAYIDGASHLQRLIHITLPCIKATIVMMLILQISKMLAIGLDAPLLLQNGKVIGVSEVISTYVYKIGLLNVDYSTATAVGLFQSVVNIILLFFANGAAKVIGEESII